MIRFLDKNTKNTKKYQKFQKKTHNSQTPDTKSDTNSYPLNSPKTTLNSPKNVQLGNIPEIHNTRGTVFTQRVFAATVCPGCPEKGQRIQKSASAERAKNQQSQQTDFKSR